MVTDSSFDQVLEQLEKYKLPLLTALVGLIFIGLGLLLPKLNFKPGEVKVQQPEAAKANLIKVDVSGAVASPGVYELASNARVVDAIYKAGGFSGEVDTDQVAVSLNLAAKLIDGQKVYVSRKGDRQNSSLSTANQIAPSLININSASVKDLDTLPGIGEVTAQKIISNRPYERIDDLLSKKVVGKATFDKIKDQISVY